MVDIANESTPVIEDLAKVSMGSTAINSIRIGGSGTAKYARAKPIVGRTATPFKPADAIPVNTPKIKIWISTKGLKLTS